MNNPETVSVVIPVLNAAPYLPELFKALFSQASVVPMEVILVDSMSTDKTCEIAQSYDKVRVVPIENFSHGRARNLGVREAKGDIVVLMTQDAVPRDSQWLANLLNPLNGPMVGATFSRQVPRTDARPMEVFFLESHFPDGGPVERKKQGDQPLRFQVEVFFSNVSAAIPRDILLAHPFDEELIMSEDQQFARDILKAGYSTVYQPDSVVIHSHRYSLTDVFKRYFDSVYSLTQVFPRHDMGASASLGLRYLWRECFYIIRHHPLHVPYYVLYTAAKSSGTLAGHFANRMPRAWLRKFSLYAYHWKDSD